jgi:hypothetical protein
MNTRSTLPLTAPQRDLLLNAAKRDDDAYEFPPEINRGAVRRSAAALMRQGLVREVRARAGMPLWRDDDDGRRLALVITKRGRNAVPPVAGQRSDAASAAPEARTGATGHQTEARPPREGSKIAAVITMLGTKTGASLTDLVDVTGWLPHTTRAALTGLRKHGHAITRSRQADGTAIYRISNGPDQTAGA